MLTVGIPRLLLFLGLLSNLILASLMRRQIKTIDDINGSFTCGRKLFLSRDVKEFYINALRTSAELITYTGTLQFDHDGNKMMLPLPVIPLKPDGRQTAYFVIIGVPNPKYFGVSNPKFLDVIFKVGSGLYNYCEEGTAGGEITSITTEAGGFQCKRHIITSTVAITFANKARNLLLTAKLSSIEKHTKIYHGDLWFPGSGPPSLWRMTEAGRLSDRGTYLMVLDNNLNVVGALEPTVNSYKPCRVVQNPFVEAKVLAPPIAISPGEYDAFRCGRHIIQTSKVRESVREASNAFGKKAKDIRKKYPNPYSGKLFSDCNSPLFLWPVRIEGNSGPIVSTRNEPFLAVITESVDIYGVVSLDQRTQKYKVCQRMSVKADQL